jgi:hypothetical protein
MEIDGSIVQLGEKLDEWLDGNLASFASQDSVAQGKSLLAGIEIQKKLDGLKAQGLAAITALLNRRDEVTDDERAAALIGAFEFSARLDATLHDEFLDTDGCNKFIRLMDKIANALDALGSGRVALAALLDHRDAGVRASAGAYLLMVDLMPDRVIPVLRELDEKNDGSSADFTAHSALLHWKLKQKAPSK